MLVGHVLLCFFYKAILTQYSESCPFMNQKDVHFKCVHDIVDVSRWTELAVGMSKVVVDNVSRQLRKDRVGVSMLYRPVTVAE